MYARFLLKAVFKWAAPMPNGTHVIYVGGLGAPKSQTPSVPLQRSNMEGSDVGPNW